MYQESYLQIETETNYFLPVVVRFNGRSTAILDGPYRKSKYRPDEVNPAYHPLANLIKENETGCFEFYTDAPYDGISLSGGIIWRTFANVQLTFTDLYTAAQLLNCRRADDEHIIRLIERCQDYHCRKSFVKGNSNAVAYRVSTGGEETYTAVPNRIRMI